MANYVLQELPEELADGKKIVFPKMQTYSLHDYETVIKHMREYQDRRTWRFLVVVGFRHLDAFRENHCRGWGIR